MRNPKEKSKPSKTICAGCDQERRIPEGDYLCGKCRDDRATQWTIRTEPLILTGRKSTEVLELAGLLVKYDIPFSVQTESES